MVELREVAVAIARATQISTLKEKLMLGIGDPVATETELKCMLNEQC